MRVAERQRWSMFERMAAAFTTDVAIDLGTANTLVHVRGEGVIVDEPSVVAVATHSRRVLAVGRDAKEMLGKTPGNIVAVRPMRDGVIADFSITEAMIRAFIAKANARKPFARSRLLISVPAAITSIERRAVREAALAAGVREVHLIEQPMAAAVGAGMRVQEARGSMIVDIGGGTTDVAVIALGGLVSSQTLRVAGDKIDDAIVNFVRKRHNVLIGERTAEAIKLAVGSADPLDDELETTVKGRDLVTRVPRELPLGSVEIREAMSEAVANIVRAVKATLERTPPELSADIIDRGIVLLGGGGMIRNLDTRLTRECGLPTYVAENPLHAVVDGVGVVLDDLPRYQSLLL
jgi:rod shape-determining protein MreB